MGEKAVAQTLNISTEHTDKKVVAETEATGDTVRQGTQQPVEREATHVSTRRKRPLQTETGGIGGLLARSEYKPFADALRAAMTKANKTASEVAREVWGSTTDKRGYNVARGRDRVGHYLNATSYPEPENLEKLAKALDVPVAELAIERPLSNPGPRARAAPASLTLTVVAPGKMRIQVDKVVASGFALNIAAQFEASDTPGGIDRVELASVINGGKTDNENDERKAGNG